jgi:hypothetical protein
MHEERVRAARQCQAKYRPCRARVGFLPTGMVKCRLKTRSSFRWTADVPDEETKPVGSEDCLRRAVEKLGPFKHRLQADAHRLGRWEGFAVSEQFAFERVWVLATTYNRQLRLDEGAPRAKDVVDALIKVETLAGELARHLSSLDDITRHRLQMAGTGISSYSDCIHDPRLEVADVAGLPNPGWLGHPRYQIPLDAAA